MISCGIPKTMSTLMASFQCAIQHPELPMANYPFVYFTILSFYLIYLYLTYVLTGTSHNYSTPKPFLLIKPVKHSRRFLSFLITSHQHLFCQTYTSPTVHVALAHHAHRKLYRKVVFEGLLMSIDQMTGIDFYQ